MMFLLKYSKYLLIQEKTKKPVPARELGFYIQFHYPMNSCTQYPFTKPTPILVKEGFMMF